MSSKTAQVQVHKTKDYSFKQSRFDHVPQLPMRMMLAGPSGSGKTTLLVSMILDIYRGCWERIYVFSPTVHVDSATFVNERRIQLHSLHL